MNDNAEYHFELTPSTAIPLLPEYKEWLYSRIAKKSVSNYENALNLLLISLEEEERLELTEEDLKKQFETT